MKMEPKVTVLEGVFPRVEIERDKDGWAVAVTVTGTSDKLHIRARTDASLNPWLDVFFNDEELTID
jgi:hypothetical protein